MNRRTMTQPEDSSPAPRGRPVRSPEHIAETRAHIAACALNLFHQEGYAAISIRRLALESGCTPMTLYKYFENKFDILRTLWADVIGELFDGLDDIAAGEPDPVARLYAVAQGYVAFWLQHRDHYFLVFMSGGITQDDVRAFVDDAVLITRFDLLRTCLADARADGIEASKLGAKSELLFCALNGIAQGLITISGYPWPEPETLVRGAVDGALKT